LERTGERIGGSEEPSQSFKGYVCKHETNVRGWGRKEIVLRNFPLLLTLLLATCGGDVRDRRLAEVDLSNMEFVHQLARELGPTEGAALITYAAIHDPASRHFCGRRLLDSRGQEPKTIGGAVSLTLKQMAQNRAPERSKNRETPAGLLGKQLDEAIFERDMVTDHESFLLADHGAAAKHLPEWRSLEFRKVSLQRTLTSLRLQVASLNGARNPAAPKQRI
jgi:hypothetical protein